MAEELRAARGIELTGRAAPGGLAIRERREATGDTGQKTRTIRVRGVIVGEILAPRGFGCIRSRRIAEEATVEVFPFIEEVVGPGAVVRPDGGPICSMPRARPASTSGFLSGLSCRDPSRRMFHCLACSACRCSGAGSGDARGRRNTQSSRISSRCVCLTLQLTHVAIPQPAFPSPAREGCDDRSGHLQGGGSENPLPETPLFPSPGEIVMPNG